MRKFEIIEFDRDYRTVTGYEIKEFETREQADKWCHETSWTGHDYWVSRQIVDLITKSV